jgi:transcriptional regulator with XRE-family HTH domain
MTQMELGTRVFISAGYVSQFEQAVRKPQLEVAKLIDVALQTDGIFGRMCQDLIDSSPYAEYFAHAAELERLTTKICDFEPSVVPGLLQTADYARALTASDKPLGPEEVIEETVRARMSRAHILTGSQRRDYWAIFHETALRIPVGGPAVMAVQLEHIASMIRSLSAVVQVIPFAAGAHSGIGKSLRLMEFADAPPAAYTEAMYSGNLLDDPPVVKRTQEVYDLLRAVALSPEASLALIESAAEDYRQCASST